jgi:C4-type Zn-finger protein
MSPEWTRNTANLCKTGQRQPLGAGTVSKMPLDLQSKTSHVPCPKCHATMGIAQSATTTAIRTQLLIGFHCTECHHQWHTVMEETAKQPRYFDPGTAKPEAT